MNRDDLREALAPLIEEALFRMHGVVSSCDGMAEADLLLGDDGPLAGLLARVARIETNARDERAAKKIAADAADRFRDVLTECLDRDENPGDDVLVRDLRDHFGKTGPEPTRWRDFVAGALAVVDQINAAKLGGEPS